MKDHKSLELTSGDLVRVIGGRVFWHDSIGQLTDEFGRRGNQTYWRVEFAFGEYDWFLLTELQFASRPAVPESTTGTPVRKEQKDTMTIVTASLEIDVEALVRRAVRNAMAHHTGESTRWAAVGDTFGLGSTSAKELCRYFDLDPDATVFGVRCLACEP